MPLKRQIYYLTIIALAWVAIAQPDLSAWFPAFGPVISTKATAATYIYEKDQGGIPAPVAAALDKLNRRTPKVLATTFERNTVDGSGEVPEQYRIALDAAKELPSLVVQAGEKVLAVVKNPKTEADVLGAVQ